MSTKTKPKATKGPPAQTVVLPPGVNALMGKAQLCFAIGVSRRTFQAMLAAGTFPKADARVGKFPRWTVATFNEWVATKCSKPTEPTDGGRV